MVSDYDFKGSKKYGAMAYGLLLWSNGLVVKALDSQSRGPMF